MRTENIQEVDNKGKENGCEKSSSTLEPDAVSRRAEGGEISCCAPCRGVSNNQDARDSLWPPHKYNHVSTTICWRNPKESQQAAFFPTLPTESENESKIEVENNENKSGVESASPSALK